MGGTVEQNSFCHSKCGSAAHTNLLSATNLLGHEGSGGSGESIFNLCEIRSVGVCDSYTWSIAAQVIWLDRHQLDQAGSLEVHQIIEVNTSPDIK